MIDELRNLLQDSAITYPKHILKRRLNLLTKTERLRVDRLYRKIIKQQEVIDELTLKLDAIIANRAEIENDPWK